MPAIDQIKQNHPELIVRDLVQAGLKPTFVRAVLKNRGVNKWFMVRRLLINIKDTWRNEITTLHKQTQQLKTKMQNAKTPEERESLNCAYNRLMGRLNTLHDCRAQIRALCMSKRDINWPNRPSNFGWICKLPWSFSKNPRPNKKFFA